MSPPTLQFERTEFDARMAKTRLAMEQAGLSSCLMFRVN